jgi:hypothetical protein
MNERVATIEPANRREDDEDLRIADWIESTGGTCGIVPVRAERRSVPAEQAPEHRGAESCDR